MTINDLTTSQKALIEERAEGWEVIPSCYQAGFECWLHKNFEKLLYQFENDEFKAD